MTGRAYGSSAQRKFIAHWVFELQFSKKNLKLGPSSWAVKRSIFDVYFLARKTYQAPISISSKTIISTTKKPATVCNQIDSKKYILWLFNNKVLHR